MTRAQLAAHTKRAADQCHRLQAELSDFRASDLAPGGTRSRAGAGDPRRLEKRRRRQIQIDTARTLMPLPKVQKMGSTKPSNRIRVQR